MSDKPALSAKRDHRTRPYRETPDVVEGVTRLIRSVGKRVAHEDPAALAELQRLDEAVAVAWRTAIDGLRALGFTDGQLGEELHTSKQAVAQRWPR